jgi:hypothetical protein
MSKIIDKEWMIRNNKSILHLCIGDIKSNITMSSSKSQVKGMWPVRKKEGGKGFTCFVCNKEVPNHILIYVA